jgi:hypothetical protein
MTVAATLSRINEIETALLPPQRGNTGTESASGTRFAQALQQAGLAGATPVGGATSVAGAAPLAGAAPVGGGPLGAVEAARSQVGVSEQPPGSNDSPQIARYREAVQGATVGPWCAYFASWAARQAGVPLGENGEGFGSVSALWEWAQRSGRAVPAAAGPPQPGELIVWGGEHVGIVESVEPDGTIHTIEGNSANQVAQRTYGPGGGGATGYVRLG